MAGRSSPATSFQRHQLWPTCRMSYFFGGTLSGSITSSGLNPKMGSVVTFGSLDGRDGGLDDLVRERIVEVEPFLAFGLVEVAAVVPVHDGERVEPGVGVEDVAAVPRDGAEQGHLLQPLGTVQLGLEQVDHAVECAGSVENRAICVSSGR